jgi:hypothetical protein
MTSMMVSHLRTWLGQAIRGYDPLSSGFKWTWI